MRVLIVEDQVTLADDIADGLRDQGMAADVAYDGASGLEKALLNRYDVVVVDRDLPKVHGDAVCAALVGASAEARILMLTAAGTVGDRVEGLNLGADDYLVKPFAFAELVARLRALARRSPATPPVIVKGDLVFDRARRRVSRGGRPVSLTRKEMGILEVLLAADGSVVSAEELLERVWDENADPYATLQRLLVYSLAGLGLMTVASGGLGWLMAGRVLRPVRSITAAARRASQQHLGERLALQGPRDELKELADTFDQMLERLDAAFATQRRFLADASHELRTPLTVMRTAIEVTLAKPTRTPGQLEAMAAKVARSAGQAEALFEALLTLATSDQPLASVEQVDLATAAEDAIEAAAPRIRRLDLRVDTALEPAPTTGNRLLMERMIGNLVDNAVRHNNPGGWVRVNTGISDGRARFRIANSGPVVPEALLPALFEPFRRVEERTGGYDGAGLGLAIVRSIGTAHGADVDARTVPAGGLLVTVTMPAAAEEAAPLPWPALQQPDRGEPVVDDVGTRQPQQDRARPARIPPGGAQLPGKPRAEPGRSERDRRQHHAHADPVERELSGRGRDPVQLERRADHAEEDRQGAAE